MKEKNLRLYLILFFLIALTALYNHFNYEEKNKDEPVQVKENIKKEDLIENKKPKVKKEEIIQETNINNKISDNKNDKKPNNINNNSSNNNNPLPQNNIPIKTEEVKEKENSSTGHYEERQVLVSEAWTEKVLVKEAWDEYIVTSPAWDEKIEYCSVWGADYVMGYKCGNCGSEFMSANEANDHLSKENHLSYYNIQIQISEEYCKAYEYMTIHHDEVGHTIHHEAEYTYIEHPAEYRIEKYWVDD